MSKKFNWAEVDKRIRNRRAVWTPDDLSAVEDSLRKLPDSADKAEAVELEQPAVGSSSDSDEETD